MKDNQTAEASLTVIEPPSGWSAVDIGELKEYRDLFYFLVWREIKALYAQTVMGFAWAIINPLVQILIFTVVFGRVAKIDIGPYPYLLFSTVAVVPWTYMSNAMRKSSQSLVSSRQMLGKIYFPRLIFPIAPVLSALVDFAISLVIILCVMVWYRHTPSWQIVLLPAFVLYMVAVPAAVGLWLSSLSIRFRDVKFAMPFVVRMLMYSAPIVYSAEKIPRNARLLYSLNPLVGVIEGLRSCLLGVPFEWEFILPGVVTAALLLVGGAFYFRRMERVFADVI